MPNIQNLKLYRPLFASLVLSLFSTILLFSSDEFSVQKEKDYREKIHYNLLIENHTEAEKQAGIAIEDFPKSIVLRQLYLETLSCNGSEKKLLRQWQQFRRDFPDHEYQDSVLELVAKGVLHYAEISDAYSSKLYRYALADSFTDASSVDMLKEAFYDSNFMVREMALNASLAHGDEVLCSEIEKLFHREHMPSIKRKALEVLIRMKGSDAQPIVEQALSEQNLSYFDRLSLILALLNEKETIDREELVELTQSSQAIERLIAAYSFGYFSMTENLDLLKELLFDPILDVRIQAMTSLGHLRVSHIGQESVEGLIKPILDGENHQLSLLACWVALLQNYDPYLPKFRDFLFHTNPKLRLQAASLIGYSLPYTSKLAEEFFQTHSDPYVRLNLSVLMLTQRIKVKEASDQIYAFLEDSQCCMFKNSMPYPMETIWPTSLIEREEKYMGHLSASLQSEIVQFCLLNLLAVVEDVRAHNLISKFLEMHHSNAALASIPQFVRAGSSKMLDLICSFFDHPDLNKRVQAAAIVAMLKKEKKALEVLYEAYLQADRQLKEMIITLIGQIGSKDSIPFLMDAIYDPSQSLRVISASSLMRCIRN